MTNLKRVFANQIAAGKSWDEILTTSDVLFLPLAGQALTEYSQASAELKAGLEKLKAQGLPIGTQEERRTALDILGGNG
ncbi:MAG: hypothetical protein AAB250_11880, partial [Bdellovibrionota bacterium]